jgi:hypothetical protein
MIHEDSQMSAIDEAVKRDIGHNRMPANYIICCKSTEECGLERSETHATANVQAPFQRMKVAILKGSQTTRH